MLGRAGRLQYYTFGEGIIITNHSELQYYLHGLVISCNNPFTNLSIICPCALGSKHTTIHASIGTALKNFFHITSHTPALRCITTSPFSSCPPPLPALHNKESEAIYSNGIQTFNTIQTQVFQALYTTDENIFIGAPTGSGKTICAEFALLRLWSKREQPRVVCIEPYQETVDQRMAEWGGGSLRDYRAAGQEEDCELDRRDEYGLEVTGEGRCNCVRFNAGTIVGRPLFKVMLILRFSVGHSIKEMAPAKECSNHWPFNRRQSTACWWRSQTNI